MILTKIKIVIQGFIARKRIERLKRKYIYAIGKYDENKNRKNHTFLVGKSDTRGEEEWQKS